MKQTFKTATKTDGGNFDLLKYDEGGEVIGLKDADELAEDFDALIHEAVENLDDSDALELGNDYRDDTCYDRLEKLDEYNVNEALDGYSPWDIINLEIDTGDDYFIWDGYDFRTTCDVWDDIDTDEVAEWVIRNEDAHGISDLEDIIDEYNEALSLLEDLEAEAEEDDAEAEEQREREEQERRERERREERARTIKSLCMVALSKAIEADDKINCVTPSDVREELARLGVALSELFDAVAEHGQFDEVDARREELAQGITSQFIKEEV